MKKRVPAFTIMEITVAMLIAAIVIGMAYTCFNIIYKSIGGFKTRQSALVDMGQLNQTLQRDIEKSELILQDEDGIIIKNSDHQITYHFRPAYILRISASIDTFKVATDSLTKYFENNISAAPNDTEEKNRIDELSFIIIYNNAHFPYYYTKQYSSQNLFNRTPDALH